MSSFAQSAAQYLGDDFLGKSEDDPGTRVAKVAHVARLGVLRHAFSGAFGEDHPVTQSAMEAGWRVLEDYKKHVDAGWTTPGAKALRARTHDWLSYSIAIDTRDVAEPERSSHEFLLRQGMLLSVSELVSQQYFDIAKEERKQVHDTFLSEQQLSPIRKFTEKGAYKIHTLLQTLKHRASAPTLAQQELDKLKQHGNQEFTLPKGVMQSFQGGVSTIQKSPFGKEIRDQGSHGVKWVRTAAKR